MVKHPLDSTGGVIEADSVRESGRSLEEGTQPTPGFLSGEPHGQKSLAGYGPWGHKELDTTEAT